MYEGGGECRRRGTDQRRKLEAKNRLGSGEERTVPLREWRGQRLGGSLAASGASRGYAIGGVGKTWTPGEKFGCKVGTIEAREAAPSSHSGCIIFDISRCGDLNFRTSDRSLSTIGLPEQRKSNDCKPPLRRSSSKVSRRTRPFVFACRYGIHTNLLSHSRGSSTPILSL